jgi:serine protease Do
VIRKTLAQTKAATFLVKIPDPDRHGAPVPVGTGFFVSEDGWFVTARHVVAVERSSGWNPRPDISKSWLMKETNLFGSHSAVFGGIRLDHVDPVHDFALLKVDFVANARADWLAGRTGFPYIAVSTRALMEGEPVYSFGYPLSEADVQRSADFVTVTSTLCPRTTSAIVSSNLVESGPVMTDADEKSYVLDKALNYGNSGGPIVASETGFAHALCSRFQPVAIPQRHWANAKGEFPWVLIPSLYGVVLSLGNPRILAELSRRRVPLQDS